MSKTGQEMSGNEPYLVKNKSGLDLVLFTPSQLQEFFKEDGRSNHPTTPPHPYTAAKHPQSIPSSKMPAWATTSFEALASALELRMAHAGTEPAVTWNPSSRRWRRRR